MHGTVLDLLLLAAAYGLGCLSPGYYLCRLKLRKDVRRGGDGSTSAVNAGQQCGKLILYCAAVIEVLQGWAAVEIPLRHAERGEVPLLAVLLVTAGSVLPVQLQWRGGYGTLVACGALLSYQPTLLFIFLSITGVYRAFLGKTDSAWLLSLISLPVLSHLLHSPRVVVAALSVLSLILFLPQRARITRMLAAVKERLKR